MGIPTHGRPTGADPGAHGSSRSRRRRRVLRCRTRCKEISGGEPGGYRRTRPGKLEGASRSMPGPRRVLGGTLRQATTSLRVPAIRLADITLASPRTLIGFFTPDHGSALSRPPSPHLGPDLRRTPPAVARARLSAPRSRAPTRDPGQYCPIDPVCSWIRSLVLNSSRPGTMNSIVSSRSLANALRPSPRRPASRARPPHCHDPADRSPLKPVIRTSPSGKRARMTSSPPIASMNRRRVLTYMSALRSSFETAAWPLRS